MDLFSFAKKLVKGNYADSSSISDDEKEYYRSDDYYVYEIPDVLSYPVRVIEFEERKKSAYPSRNGLYPAEIVLLYYCSLAKLPKPITGYQGFWWFEYGIRDVGHALESLEKRNFIKFADYISTLKKLSPKEINIIIEKLNIPSSKNNKKNVENILEYFSNSKNVDVDKIVPKKYELTELGCKEIEENEYIVYMHRNQNKNVCLNKDNKYDVWAMNNYFHNKGLQNWKKEIGKIELKLFKVDFINSVKNKESSKMAKTCTPEEIREYLKQHESEINTAMLNDSDGFEEDLDAISLRKAGKEKEALVKFHIAIRKKFIGTAPYEGAAIIYRKYKMYDEELKVVEAGIKYTENEWFIKRKERVIELMNKEKEKNI